MIDFLKYFLAFDIGVLVGMGLMSFVVMSGGCYEGCLMTKQKDA